MISLSRYDLLKYFLIWYHDELCYSYANIPLHLIFGKKIYNFSELWKELICFNIDEESKKFFESLNKSNPTNDKNKINKYKDEIYFSQIIPLIGSMKSLGKNIGEIKNIINFLIKKYDIPDKTSLTIFGAMEY